MPVTVLNATLVRAGVWLAFASIVAFAVPDPRASAGIVGLAGLLLLRPSPSEPSTPVESDARPFLDALDRAVAPLLEGNWDTPIPVPEQASEIQKELTERLEALRVRQHTGLESIHRAAESVRRTSIQLGQASQDLYQEIASFSAMLLELSSGARDQSERATELQEGMATVLEQAGRFRDLAAEAQASGTEVCANIAAGQREVEVTLSDWAAAIDRMHQIGTDLTGFGQTTRDIGTIVEIIADIAHRTNVLSLNAALEADRAGEQGDAFALIASEIRDLSDDARRQASEIDQLLKTFLERQDEVLLRVTGGIENLSGAADAIDTLRSRLDATTKGTEQISDQIGVLADGFAAVAEAIDVMRSRVEEVAQTSETHAELTERTVTQSRDRMLVGADQLLHESRNLDRVWAELDQSLGASANKQETI